MNLFTDKYIGIICIDMVETISGADGNTLDTACSAAHLSYVGKNRCQVKSCRFYEVFTLRGDDDIGARQCDEYTK